MIWLAIVVGVFFFWGDDDLPSIFVSARLALRNKVNNG